MAFCKTGEHNFSKTWNGISRAQCSKCGALNTKNKTVMSEVRSRRGQNKKKDSNASKSKGKQQSASKSGSKNKNTSGRNTGQSSRNYAPQRTQEIRPEGSLPTRATNFIPRGATSQKPKGTNFLNKIVETQVASEVIQRIPKKDNPELHEAVKKTLGNRSEDQNIARTISRKQDTKKRRAKREKMRLKFIKEVSA